MSFLCNTINKVVDYDKCVNECQYIFKSGCVDIIKEGYNQGRVAGIKDFADFISDYFDDPKLYCNPDKLIRMYKEYRGSENE